MTAFGPLADESAEFSETYGNEGSRRGAAHAICTSRKPVNGKTPRPVSGVVAESAPQNGRHGGVLYCLLSLGRHRGGEA
ncbi:hypothetical protein AB0I54_42730 [Streptomyces sp. NPDC050625]|uniref:hypothetical protein n=1 Tax=Streptomyces sp. NPDC050625 TaxID=3154629 RepID=UPI0034333227